jgi:hypothetical protein
MFMVKSSGLEWWWIANSEMRAGVRLLRYSMQKQETLRTDGTKRNKRTPAPLVPHGRQIGHHFPALVCLLEPASDPT